MGIRNKLIKSILPLLLFVAQTSAINCNCDGYFCVSDREYQLCENGEVAGDPVPCDEGIICRNETEIDCSRQPLCQKRQGSQDEENSSDNFRSLCQGQGLYPDPESCERFYMCIGFGVGKLMQCPAGTYYNEGMFVCLPNLPERCRSTTDPVTDQTDQYVTDGPLESDDLFDCPGIGLFADPDNCQRYYQCDEAQQSFLRDCSEGTYFDEELQDCVSRIPERCRGADTEPSTVGDVSEATTDGAQTTQTSQTDGTTVYPTDDTQSTNQEGTTDNGEVTTNNAEVVTTIRTEPTDGTTVYPTDDTQSTNQEGTTDNGEVTTDNVEIVTTLRTEFSDGTTPTTTSPPKYADDFICPGEGYFPDLADCQRYYVCDVVDKPMRISCPEGTYYDEDFEFCSKDMPERCLGSDAPPVTSTPKTEDPTTESVSTRIPDESGDRTEGLTTTTAPTPSDFVCPNEGLFPDPKDCRRYYVCIDLDQFFSVACPNDTYFDAENTFCADGMPERCRESGRPSDGVSSTSTEQTTMMETGMTETPTSTSEGTTPKTPEGGFECPGEGYFADPDNCQNYFVCFSSGDSFVGIPVVCPKYTYFDEESDFCTSDIPERCSGQSGGSTTSPPKYDDEFICPGEGYFPDPTNCNRYYMCYVDFAIPLACPNGTYFNDENNLCTEQVPERCRASDDDINRPTTPSYTERPTTEKNNNGFECPGEGYYADPENCKEYFICYNWGSPIPVSCPENTYFDEDSSFCTKDMPERCRVTGRPPQNEVTSTTPSVPTEDEFTCPGEGYYPNPKDCQSYYICYGGDRFILLSCPENTFYDDESSFCRSNMPDRCRVTERPTEDNTYATTTPNNDIDTTPAPGQDVFRCPGEGYFPDTEDCHRYYACFGFGPPLRLTCPDDSYFNEKGFCTSDRPERCTPQYTAKPPQEGTDKIFKCPGSGQFSDPKDCQKYWICLSNNFGYPVQCPNGTYYDEDSTYCTSRVPDRCKGPDDKSFICPGEGYFANPVDCHSYYVCYSRGISMPMRCPGNSYYHQSMEGCAPDMPETCKKPDGGEKFICPRAGLFPDPRDCSRYYVCNFWGDFFLMKCPSGRYFNENIRGCSSKIPPRCQSVMPPLQNGFMCSSTGYFADPVNCSVYHICNILGRHYTASCPSKMYYHEDTRTCSPIIPDRCIYLEAKMSALCSDRNSQEKPLLSDTGYVLNNTFVCPDKGLFPDPYDCQKFYVCYGQPRRVTCWGKTYYSEETQQCEEDMPERCKAADRPTLPPNISTTPQPEGFVCPDKGLFPDPDDCRRFYVCYGEPRRVTCRNGKYFDDESQQCSEDLPDRCKANGGDNVTPQPTNPPSTSQPGEFICPDKGLFPHPTDCHKFYVCYGDPREVTCWGNTYFDEESQKCVEDLPERCRSNGDGNVTPMPPPTSQPGEFVCPGQGLFPDPDDCRRFYVCYGQPRQVTCRHGKYFDDESQQCSEDIPDRCKPIEGETSTTVAPTTPTTTESPTTTSKDVFDCRSPGRYPDPLDCQSFYYCNWRQEASHFTCKDSTYFNDVTNKCQPEIPDRCRSDADRDTTTTPRLPSAFVCREAGRYPDPEDCLKYYYCSKDDSTPIHYSCPTNQFFNSDKNKCKKIKTGHECPTGNPDRIHSHEGEEDDEDDEDEEDEEDFVCSQAGLFPDRRDCKKFYQCTLSLKMKHRTCSGRSYFNERFRYCSIFTTERCKDYGIFW